MPRDITHEVEWVPGIVAGGGGEFVPEWSKQELHLRGIRKGRATLSATYEGSSLTVAIEILESDMLLYAPDGFIYRVPTEVWTHARPAPPHDPNPTRVVRYRPEELPSHIQSLLENEVALANVPGGVNLPSPSQKDIAPSDNITCFLLNLNSIMLSYSPRKARAPGSNAAVLDSPPAEAPESVRSKPAARKARKTAPRRKRG
ncbi:hypothetical protein D187_003604 [Cystobacter fuscus DSM 2262]|uniref:Uncharacterized protein n=2 Tax=Cystobacter fuscus TaxID=43 RepID=S9QC27_CYSF2|nr:hypothetical protein D187_003604 [Cystobacter fuscus DSM 2262]